MSPTIPAFDDQVLRTTLEKHGFSRDLFGEHVESEGFRVPLVAFSHRPFDSRTACLVAIPPSQNVESDIRRCSRIGAPLILIGSDAQWDIWFQSQRGPQLWWPKTRGPVSKFFREVGQRVTPQSIFRAKTLARVDANEQLEFVDLGAFEVVERETGRRLTKLITAMIGATSEQLGWDEDLSEGKSQWLVRANFWLLAARILHDKNVRSFKRLDLADVADVFNRVRRHYGAGFKEQEPANRISALAAAVAELKRSPSLGLVSTESLADPFENALITKETRRAHGTHSTPGWLVEYMLGRLRPWIEELAAQDRSHVFEPACGHAPFLLGALRLLSSLPPCNRLGDAERHDFLKQRLHGCERDDFAREVARLSLTLADIPNPNGWDLGRDGDHDLFCNERIQRGVKEADIVLCNPPYEADKTTANGEKELFHIKKAAEVLRRTVGAAKAGTIIGFVLPQTMLDSHKLVDLRHQLTRDFEWLEVCRLPDKVFEKADVETALLLARRHSTGELKLTVGPTSFRHVWERGFKDFRNTLHPTTEQHLPLDRFATDSSYRLLVPDLLEIWDHLSRYKKLSDLTDVGRGFGFLSEDNSAFPKGETQVSATKTEGYWRGFYGLQGAPDTHLLPELKWMNSNPLAVAEKRAGFVKGKPQIILNHIRVQRGPWKLKAYTDRVGQPTRGEFLLVRPALSHPNWSLEFIWAVLNSPIANAYAYAQSTRRHVYSGTISQLPVIAATAEQIAKVETAARAYRETANRWSATHLQVKRKRSKASKDNSDNTTAPLLGILSDPTDEQSQLLELKYLHWRMDAEVLALYNLPAKLERQLLDYFTGERRVGVPFDQTEYFPKGFEGAERLSELLAITADWPRHARREAKLIKREYDNDGLPAKELLELERLQRLGALHLKLTSPLDRSELDAEIDRLKREGKWTE